jgi:hypothetical protein
MNLQRFLKPCKSHHTLMLPPSSIHGEGKTDKLFTIYGVPSDFRAAPLDKLAVEPLAVRPGIRMY